MKEGGNWNGWDTSVHFLFAITASRPPSDVTCPHSTGQPMCQSLCSRRGSADWKEDRTKERNGIYFESCDQLLYLSKGIGKGIGNPTSRRSYHIT